MNSWKMRSKRLKKERILACAVAKRLLDSRSPVDREIDTILTRLGWNKYKQRLIRESYAGRNQLLLDYMRRKHAA